MAKRDKAPLISKLTVTFMVLFIVASAVAAYGFLSPATSPPTTLTMTQSRVITETRTVGTASTVTVTRATAVTETKTVAAEAAKDIPPPPQDLIEAAKKDGEVVVYSTTGKFNLEPFINVFTAKYGVKVNFVQISSPEFAPRIAAEYQAGAYKFDILLDVSILDYMKADSLYLQAFKVPGVDKVYPAGTFDPDGYYYPIFKNPAATVYNPSKVSPQELKGVGWQQFANDPKWKGRIGLRELDKGANLYFTMMLKVLYGADGARDWAVRIIKNQKPLIHSDTGFLRSAVARGEVDLTILTPATTYDRGITAGENLRYHADFPAGELAGVEWLNFVGIARKAPHLNAAKLWQWYTVTLEGQAALGELNAIPHPFAESKGSSFKGLNAYLVTPRVIDIEAGYVRELWMRLKEELKI